MKINPRDAGSFIAKPDPSVRAFLFHGENAGLAAEYAGTVARQIVPDPHDRESLVDLSPETLRKEPDRLADEAAQLSMFSPGRRVIRIRDASESMGEIFAAFLQRPTGDARIVVEAGELSAKSSLRTVFEGSRSAAAVQCFDDDMESLARLGKEVLTAAKIAVEDDALELGIRRCGMDRRLLRSELAKVILTLDPAQNQPAVFTRALALELFGASGGVESDEISLAVALGEVAKTDALLAKAEEAGGNASTLVSATLRHLHAILAAKAQGPSGEDVQAARQKGLWGQSDTVIRAQLRLWSLDRLTAAIRVLGEAEAMTRTTGLPEGPIAARALLHAARLAG
jgi:DNA polymerase-3 subunit delta